MKFSSKQLTILGVAAMALVGAGVLQSSSIKKVIVGALSGSEEEKKEETAAAAEPEKPAPPASPAFDPTKPSGLDDGAKQGSFSDEDDDDYEPNPEMQAIMDAREARQVAFAKKHSKVDASPAEAGVSSKIVEPLPGVTVRVANYTDKKAK